MPPASFRFFAREAFFPVIVDVFVTAQGGQLTLNTVLEKDRVSSHGRRNPANMTSNIKIEEEMSTVLTNLLLTAGLTAGSDPPQFYSSNFIKPHSAFDPAGKNKVFDKIVVPTKSKIELPVI